MGNTTYKGSSAAEIHLEDGDKSRTYAPGDTITGRVSRSEPTVSVHAVVKIKLSGRTKTKIHNYRGSNNNVVYRGRFTVIDEEALEKTIFAGPVHVASNTGPASWPFSIKIPRHCSPRKLKNSAPRGESFLQLDAHNIAAQPLPDSFGLSHRGQDADSEGFVEYFLEATISYPGSRQTHESVLPVTIRTPNIAPPLDNFNLTQHRMPEKLSSWRLLPGSESAELSFTQKRQKFFGSSKVPRIAGAMEVNIPSILQLGNPSPIPIHLRFVPDAKNISSDLQGVDFKIELTSLNIQIVSRTDLRCHAAVFSPRETAAEKIWSHNIWPPSTDASSEPLHIPYSGELPAVDVGARAGFRLPGYLSDPGTAPRDRLLAGFTTYNIKHSHTVRFRLVATVSGQEMKMKVQGPLSLLPPNTETTGSVTSEKSGSPSTAVAGEEAPPSFQEASESWIRPPAEGDAPPTFARTEKEHVGLSNSVVAEGRVKSTMIKTT